MARGGYDFYLQKCLLPVPPEKMQVKINSANKAVTLINGEQVNILKKPGLTDIEFECLLPQVRYPFAVYKSKFRRAKYFLDYFEGLKLRQKPFQFIVSRRLPDRKRLYDTNMKVSMEDYQITEDAKEGNDVKVKIKLKQYREFGTRVVKIKKDKKDGKDKAVGGGQPRETDNSPAPPAPQQYTVVKGDCLWGIAKKFYGDGSQWERIYNANPGVCGRPYEEGGITYSMIYPGDVLTIPPI